MEQTNLNMLFIDMLPAYAFLVTYRMTKEQFCEAVKNCYSMENPRNQLFYLSAQRSVFETIELSSDRECILFNAEI